MIIIRVVASGMVPIMMVVSTIATATGATVVAVTGSTISTTTAT